MFQKSRTPLVHHLTPFYFTISKPGATDPRPTHQALAPPSPISLCAKPMFVTVLLTFNALARACGQKRWQTVWNMRTYKAICDTNIKPCPPPKNWNQQTAEAKIVRKHEKSRWISAENIIYLSDLLVGESESCRNTFPCHTSILLPSNFQDSFGKIMKDPHAPQLSNTTELSQVSTTTGTPLDSILFHHFKTWSHRPPSHAPGLGSSVANFIVCQADVRNCLVDFQCFGKGLWTKTMANHLKHENLQGDLRQHTAMSTITQLKWTNSGRSDPGRNFQSKTNTCLLVCAFSCTVHFCSFTCVRNPSSLHPRTLSERSAGPTSEHLSNTTNVSEVSNTTGTLLDSIVCHPSATWRVFFPVLHKSCHKSSSIRRLYFFWGRLLWQCVFFCS